MNGSDMPRSPRSTAESRHKLIAGQRVRVIRGPLCDLVGIIESNADSDRVLVNAGENIPGLSVRIPARLLEILDP
jgi:hypothetical protein